MYLYMGPEDPSRMAPKEVREDELRAHIHTAMDLEVEKVPLGVAVEPFLSRNPPSDVSYFS